MADHMTLSHWFIYIHYFLPEVYTRCNNAANCVATISRTNSNSFEFVRLIAATKFCLSDRFQGFEVSRFLFAMITYNVSDLLKKIQKIVKKARKPIKKL